MRASTQSVMNTLWSASSVRTVSRSSVEWWPDSGATTSTVGSSFNPAMQPASSLKRLKRSSLQNGVSSTVRCSTATSVPCARTWARLNSGFS